jgi:hypothetical protein
VLIRGEAKSAAYALQNATKSESGSRAGICGIESSGTALAGTAEVEVDGGATLVNEAHKSKTCRRCSDLACAHCSLRRRPASRDSMTA